MKRTRLIVSFLILSIISPLFLTTQVYAATSVAQAYSKDWNLDTGDAYVELDRSTNAQMSLSALGDNTLDTYNTGDYVVTYRPGDVSISGEKVNSEIYGLAKDGGALSWDRVYRLSIATKDSKDSYDSSKKIYKNDFYVQGRDNGSLLSSPLSSVQVEQKTVFSSILSLYNKLIADGKPKSDILNIKIYDVNSVSSITLKEAVIKAFSGSYLAREYFTSGNVYSASTDQSSDELFTEQSSIDNTVIDSFYAKMTENSDLQLLIKLYDIFINSSDTSIKTLASTATAALPSDDVGKFIVFSINGNRLSPARAAEIRAEEEMNDILDAVDKNNGVSNTDSYSDWVIAATAIHNGVKEEANVYTPDFLDINNIANLKDFEKAKIITILQLWNAKLPSNLKGTSLLTSARIQYYGKKAGTVIPDSYREVMDQSMSYINSLGDEDDPQYLYRMLTFESRLKYLAGASYSEDAILPDSISSFYTVYDNVTNFAVSSKLSTVTIGKSSILGGQFPINNGTAYTYFVDTVTELYEYSRVVAPLLNTWITDKTIGERSRYVEALLSVYNGLKYIDSEEAWEIWNTGYTSGTETGPSLNSIYEELQKENAFDGISTSTILQTGEPLQMFFSLKEKKLSSYYLKGIAYSSTYIPMSTNIYDAYTVASYDEDFLNNFHYKYGFNRKALYIDTNAKSAVDLYTTKRKGNLRVCTLKDLISPEKDIVLYIDDNFYNVNTLAELQGKTLDRLDNVDNATSTKTWYEQLWDSALDGFTIDIYEQTKTAENTKYSDKLRKKLTDDPYYPEAEAGTDKDNKKQYVLTSSQIKDYLDGTTTVEDPETRENVTTYDNYNILQSYALVSAIYRDSTLYKEANSEKMSNPVFISSPELAGISGTSTIDKQSLLNYLLLKNLSSNMPVGYNYNIDMYSPVYMDIYGNILTESGYVIVPAACNSTLFDDKYSQNLYNMGLFSVYGDAYSLPLDYTNVDNVMNYAFEKDSTTDSWKVKSRMVDGKVADYARLTTGDKSVTDAIQKQFEYNLDDSVKMYNLDSFVNICLEVMRGAPIEYIDKDFEGLNVNRRISKAGLVAAAKLEELQTALKSGDSNAIISIPNLAFVDGMEYVVVFAFKIVFFIVMVILMFTVFIDTVRTQLNLRTLWKCTSVIILTVIVLVATPTVFQLTYYQSNKSLLQQETSYIAMLNLEKDQSGVEVGVYDVNSPDISTKLLLKLDDINVPWYDVFSKVMLSSTFNNLSSVYDRYFQASSVSNQSDITVMNDGVYMYVDDLFESADVEINLSNNELYLRTDETLTASFYSPYYVVLESLISHINQYNVDNNWYAYTTKTQKGGKLKSVGMASAYFNSTDFMESEGDTLNFWEVYNIQPSLESSTIFSTESLRSMESSEWHSTILSNEQIYKRLEKLGDYERKFITENKSLLGKISDESFLKVMALSIAMKHNQLFGVQKADSYEIYNLSNDDLLRLSIAPRDLVMVNSTLTYPRFVYEVGGTPAVYAAALLSMITWVSSYLKPLATLLVFLAIFISIFVFKICLRKESSSLYGYIITTLLLCSINLAHSLILKSFMYLPYLNLAPTVSLLLMCIVQIQYMYVLCYITYVAFREWRDLGFDRYESKSKSLIQKIPFLNKNKNTGNPLKGNSNERRGARNNWQYYNNLVDKHKYKNKGVRR